jgi:glutaminyl-peptide cyclotransferase
VSRSTRILPSAAVLAVASCTSSPAERVSTAQPSSAPASVPLATASVAAAPSAPRESSSLPPSSSGVIATFPHDITSFTEGLVYDRGVFYESTGLYGESLLRKVDVASGRVLAEVKLARSYFGEGLALLDGELYQLTYREMRCFVYDAATLEKRRELHYEGEGWGLTTDGTQLVMSDGSATITFRDRKTLLPERRITVVGASGPILQINELEWIDGYILANVWGTNSILRIDPASGRVVAVKDFSYLPEPRRGTTEDDVMNGIAYDAEAGRLFVTGKRWSHIFQVPRF